MDTSTRRRSRAWIYILLLASAVSVTQTTLAHKGLQALQTDPKQWVMPNGNYSGWNYSRAGPDQPRQRPEPVDGVDAFSSAFIDSHEASPLVIGDTMYIVTPKPNYVYALDLTRDGVIKWEFRPEMPQMEARDQGAPAAARRRAAWPTPTARSSTTRSTARSSR